MQDLTTIGAVFSEASFQWHLNGLSATSWYIILIVQPWLYQNRPIQVHRKVGMIGLLLAGIVVASALSVIKGNLLAESGPIFPIRYSLLLIDILTVIGFTVSVILSVLNAKNTQVHAHCFLGLASGDGQAIFSPARNAVSPQRIL